VASLARSSFDEALTALVELVGGVLPGSRGQGRSAFESVWSVTIILAKALMSGF